MVNVIVLTRFRGVEYDDIYEKDKTYPMEEARAQSLALRGLVQVVDETNHEEEKGETLEVLQENEDTLEVLQENEETSVEEPLNLEEETPKKKGRKSAK